VHPDIPIIERIARPIRSVLQFEDLRDSNLVLVVHALGLM